MFRHKDARRQLESVPDARIAPRAVRIFRFRGSCQVLLGVARWNAAHVAYLLILENYRVTVTRNIMRQRPHVNVATPVRKDEMAMVNYELLRADGILVIRPEGSLDATDFQNIAQKVDPYIETSGKLHRVMIDAKAFLGFHRSGRHSNQTDQSEFNVPT